MFFFIFVFSSVREHKYDSIRSVKYSLERRVKALPFCFCFCFWFGTFVLTLNFPCAILAIAENVNDYN